MEDYSKTAVKIYEELPRAKRGHFSIEYIEKFCKDWNEVRKEIRRKKEWDK